MAATYRSLDQLLAANAQWAVDVAQAEPGFFSQCAKGQSPHTLWIGCADSRVPESVITGCKPGEIFVHRNVANQFNVEDDNVSSVLDYAVDHLGVKHVAIVGHSECGGVTASLGAAQREGFDPEGQIATLPSLPLDAPLNRWLGPLSRLIGYLGVSTVPLKEALPLAIEENVKHQVDKLCKSPTIVGAWSKGKDVSVHGLVYELGTGRLRDLGVTRSKAT